MNSMLFAIINKNHFILMFVNRRASRVKPGLKDNQVYIPQKRQALYPEFPKINSKYMAQFYLNQLQRLGYIPDPPAPPEPNPNNVLISTVTSSDGTYLDINSVSGLLSLSGADLEEGAIDPMPDPDIQYNVTFVSGASVTFSASQQAQIMHHELLYQEMDNFLAVYYESDHSFVESITLTNIKALYPVVIFGQRWLQICLANGDNYSLCANNIQWKIDLTPVQTLFMIRFTPVENP